VPDRHRLSGATRSGLGAAAAALTLAACGPPPPQAPVEVASKVSSALTTIAAMCGESYRAQAFSPAPDLARFQRAASSSAETLAHDAQRHPNWIYQGMTLAQLRHQARARLRECGLGAAARPLG
jgi:hypothetical protein